MKAPYSWLKAYCDPQLPAAELAELLNMRTCEVDGIQPVGPPSPDGFVVGHVVEIEPHPDADRLRVCHVDTGDGTRTIVCGASNVDFGQTVAVALPGAVMPGGMTIKQAKLRGVASEGMICSEAELGLGGDSDGIMVLGTDAASDPVPGTPLSELLPVSDEVFDLDVTSNRVDLLGIYGVARELHAVTGKPLEPAPWESDAEASGVGDVGDYASVSVEVPELCPRFTARVFTDVKIGPSPAWLRARIIGAGQRPINNVVDITNYVMLLMAQPLHAFDLDKVPGGALSVRAAKPGETMRTLDGNERTFEESAVLVCDANGPSGIAGIMGGEVSEVSEETTSVLLEVATWNGVNILKTSRTLGLRSEASNRFEKQLHPALAMQAQAVASKLMVELCGARLVPGTIDVAGEIPPAHEVTLREGLAERLLGMPIDPGLCLRYLEALGFGVEQSGAEITAVVPFHRHYDVSREVDLIEEVGRIHGYDEHLPSTFPNVSQAGGLSHEQVLRRRIEDVVRDFGFDAIVSLSLTDPGAAKRLRIGADDPRGNPIRVSNPLSAEHSELRTTLLGSLLDGARFNRAHGAGAVALFEVGRAYLRRRPDGAASEGILGGSFAGELSAVAYEPQRVGALTVGHIGQSGWRDAAPEADFFALKGVLEALATQLGVEVVLERAEEPFLHPGRAARVLAAETDAGWIGELHPLVARAWDIEAGVAFELDLAALVAASPIGGEHYEDVTTHPASYQDLAVIVAEDVSAATVRTALMDGGGELLRSATVFDIYRGDQVGEGRWSLAFRLEFRAPDRTLTDEEVNGLRAEIVSRLQSIGGELRA